MALRLDGKTLAQKIRSDLAKKIATFPSKPHLVVFLSFPDPASQIYVRNKIKACEEIGIQTTLIDREFTETNPFIGAIQALPKEIDGILVQFPLHKNVNKQKIIDHIDPNLDVDGCHPVNLGKLITEDPTGFVPCTPLGIQTMLHAYSIETKGKHVVVVGRSATVGKPLALLLAQKNSLANATVTLAHSATQNLAEITLSADIIVAAAGQQNLITAPMIKEGAVLIDVGINRNPKTNELVGDIDFPSVEPKCSAISPVPGGVGPMTVASLMVNTVKSYELTH